MNTSPERSAQVSIVAWMRQVLPRGSLVASIKNEHQARAADPISRARFWQKRKKEGVLGGFPDVLICLVGRVLFIETKRPNSGVLSNAQEDRHTELRTLGHPVAVCTDIESARYFLQSERVPLSETAGQLARPAKFRVEKDKRLRSDPLPF